MYILANAAQKRTSGKRKEKLKKLPLFRDQSYEDTYQTAYSEMLKGIWEQREEDAELARKILRCLIFTQDPVNLKTSMVQRALALKEHNTAADPENEVAEEDLISVCRGLVTVDHQSHC